MLGLNSSLPRRPITLTYAFPFPFLTPLTVSDTSLNVLHETVAKRIAISGVFDIAC